MRDHDHGAPFGRTRESALNFPFGLGVERTRRLVQQQDWWIFEQSACDSHALLFAPREL